MNEINIKVASVIDNRIFVVYYSAKWCYQFSILDEYGCCFDCPEVYYTVEAAENKARRAITTLLD